MPLFRRTLTSRRPVHLFRRPASTTTTFLHSPQSYCRNQSRRGSAKAYGDDYEEVDNDNGASSEMDAAIDALSPELLKLHTPGILDHIIVESGGGVVSDIDPNSVTPFDPHTLNPRPADQRLIASIPSLTKEHMQAVCKVVAKSAEDAKQSVRPTRLKALDLINKAVPKKTRDDSSFSISSGGRGRGGGRDFTSPNHVSQTDRILNHPRKTNLLQGLVMAKSGAANQA